MENDKINRLCKRLLIEFERAGSAEAFYKDFVKYKVPKKYQKGKKLVCKMVRGYIYDTNNTERIEV